MNDTQSIWLGTAQHFTRPRAPYSGHYDIVIAGGGIVGISAAFALRDSGLKIAVVEARTLLGDVTGHTTGKLTSQHGLIYDHIINTFGIDAARKYADMNQWAIEEVGKIVSEESIDCDYVRDEAYVYATTDETAEKIGKELSACLELGLPASMGDPDLPYPVKAALKFENQARYHPVKFLLGLVDRIEGKVEFFENTRVIEIEENNDGCAVRTEIGELTADKVVVATNYPIYDSGLFVARIAPYKSYAVAVDIARPMPSGMYITEDEPLRSLRRQKFKNREVQIIGGGHHKVGQEEDTAMCFSELLRWADDNFEIKTLLFKWSTQDNWSADRLPFIGKSPNRERIFVATGFGGWGMTTGIASGKILSDAVLGKENAWASAVDPARLPLAAVPAIAKENLNAAKHLIGDRILRAQSPEFAGIPMGDAAIVQMKDERVAAYRDHDGQIHAVTSSCTHWGCELRWNSAETTWDCPCHGSRFDIEGDVLHGPAVMPLEKRIVDDTK